MLERQIADMTMLARRHELHMLGFLLDMALLEAQEKVRILSGGR